MNDKPKGVKYVIGLFGALGGLLACAVAWHVFGKPTAFMPEVGQVHPLSIAVTLSVAGILLFAAFSLSRTASRWAWILALLLNVLLLGSVLILPLLVASLIVLLKRKTREHFGIIRQEHQHAAAG